MDVIRRVELGHLVDISVVRQAEDGVECALAASD